MRGIAIVASFIVLGIILSTRTGHASTVPALPPPDPNPPLPPVLEEDEEIERDLDRVDTETESDIRKELDEQASKLPAVFTSVISGVSNEKWTAYVKKQKQGKLNGVTKTNNLGLFLMGYRMLQDLGYVKNAHKIEKDGRTVWTGDFIPPLTLTEYLRNAMLQYESFAKMTQLQAAQIRQKYKDVLAGSTITLSGLLAVAKYAGMGGLQSWLTEPAKRKQETTNEFNAFNGMF